jgi:rubrerythrin
MMGVKNLQGGIEMAKDKEHEAAHKVRKVGDKYYCIGCGAELEFGKDCPFCKTSFEWDKIMYEAQMRR